MRECSISMLASLQISKKKHDIFQINVLQIMCEAFQLGHCALYIKSNNSKFLRGASFWKSMFIQST